MLGINTKTTKTITRVALEIQETNRNNNIHLKQTQEESTNNTLQT